jgi:hypothetical protein
MVGGRWVIRQHRHAQATTIASSFTEAMTRLWDVGV